MDIHFVKVSDRYVDVMFQKTEVGSIICDFGVATFTQRCPESTNSNYCDHEFNADQLIAIAEKLKELEQSRRDEFERMKQEQTP